MFRFRIIAAAVIAATVSGCDKKEAHDPPARRVRTVTIERGVKGETISLTGQIRAKDQGSLAFRIGGRMLDRPVNVGEVVKKPGQLVARLDPKDQQASHGASQSRVPARGADAGTPYLRAAAGALEGWLDASCWRAWEALRSPGDEVTIHPPCASSSPSAMQRRRLPGWPKGVGLPPWHPEHPALI